MTKGEGGQKIDNFFYELPFILSKSMVKIVQLLKFVRLNTLYLANLVFEISAGFFPAWKIEPFQANIEESLPENHVSFLFLFCYLGIRSNKYDNPQIRFAEGNFFNVKGYFGFLYSSTK